MTYDPSVCWSHKIEIPIVIDSGDFWSITPIPSNFIGLITPMDEPIQGLSATPRMKGIGTVRWDIRNSIYTSTSIETTAYFIPEEYIRLFRRQGYFGENLSASFVIDSTWTILTLTNQLALRFDYHKGIIFLWPLLFILLIVQCVWHLMLYNSKCVRLISGSNQSKLYTSTKGTCTMLLRSSALWLPAVIIISLINSEFTHNCGLTYCGIIMFCTYVCIMQDCSSTSSRVSNNPSQLIASEEVILQWFKQYQLINILNYSWEFTTQ